MSAIARATFLSTVDAGRYCGVPESWDVVGVADATGVAGALGLPCLFCLDDISTNPTTNFFLDSGPKGYTMAGDADMKEFRKDQIPDEDLIFLRTALPGINSTGEKK